VDVLLYPYHALQPYPENAVPNAKVVTVASSLLYFDTVTLGRLGYPDELSLFTTDEALSELRNIQKLHGEAAVQAFWRTGELSNDFTCDDIAKLSFVRYWYDEQRFRKSYAPLIEEGVVRTISLAKITENARLSADLAGSSDSQYIDLRAALAGFTSTYDEIIEWLKGEAVDQVFWDAFVDADGSGLTGLYLREMLKETSPEFLERTSDNAKIQFFRHAFLLDIFHQSLLSALLELPLVSYREAHLSLRNKYVPKMLSIQGDNKNIIGADSTAFKIFTETLIKVPAAIPRSPESLLEIRLLLSDELLEFREAVNHIAEDLEYANTGSITQRDIEHEVKKHFTRPLNALNRKLAHPNKELAQNLLTSDSTILGGITIALAALAGSPIVLSALLGVVVPILTTVAKTHLDREKEIDQSGLGFLVRASS